MGKDLESIISTLTLDEQIMIAKILISKFYNKGQALDDNPDYSMEVLKKLKELVEHGPSDDAKKLLKLLEALCNASTSVRNKAIASIILSISDVLEQATEINCAYSGHTYGPWCQRTVTTTVHTMIDHVTDDYPVTNYYWRRTCTTCGHVEEREKMPEAYRRQQKAKEEKRLKLQREIDALKNG